MISMSSLDPRPLWIATPEALREACARWRNQAMIALDTEFVRERTFFPALGLVQVAAGEATDPEVALIDAVALDDLTPLAELLAEPEVLKVVHAGSEDMVVFHHRLRALPRPLFDTQIAAAMAGWGYGLGYAGLVEAQFGVFLPKSEQRTNWLRRPLSSNQIRYAARDTAYLPAVYQQLRQRLDANDRVPWVLEDSARLLEIDRHLPAPEDAWRKVRGGSRLSDDGRGALEALAAWRERQARQRDLPRGFVLPDAALLQLASRAPSDPATLEAISELPDAARRRHGNELLRVIRQAQPSRCQAPPRPAYDPRPLVRSLQQTVAARASDLGIPKELLASRRHLETLLSRVDEGNPEPMPAALRGWRSEVLGSALVEQAHGLLV